MQNVFTVAKTGALGGLILAGILAAGHLAPHTRTSPVSGRRVNVTPIVPGLAATTAFGLIVAICVAQSGSLFSAEAWYDITFAAGEVKDPRRTIPRALIIGTAAVIGLYILTNLSYLLVLPIEAIQKAPSDRVAAATLEAIVPGWGSVIMALAIMVSTFGCVNSLVLAGARAYYAMARNGLFLRGAGVLNKAHVPGNSLMVQGVWAAALVLPRIFNPVTKQYGNLYSNLLDYVVSAALLFFIFTIGAVIRLRRTRPDAERPYRTLGYPVVPILYILGAAAILAALFTYRVSSTWPGLVIVLCGLPVYLITRRAATRV